MRGRRAADSVKTGLERVIGNNFLKNAYILAIHNTFSSPSTLSTLFHVSWSLNPIRKAFWSEFAVAIVQEQVPTSVDSYK
jgi:hypothetical protein